MKSGEGIIAEVLENDRVKIQVGREHLFTACSSCIGAERVVVTAKNTVHAKKGQTVRYQMPEGHLILGAFICFVLPLVCLALTIGAAYYVSIINGYPSIPWMLGGACSGGAAVFGLWKKMDTEISSLVKTEPYICEIIQH